MNNVILIKFIKAFFVRLLPVRKKLENNWLNVSNKDS